jgi:hypothetical protein
MKKGSKKDKFAELDEEFKNSVSSMSPDAINLKIAEVAKNENENQRLKKEDEDLEAQKVLYKEAGQSYKDATKANKLRIAFMIRVLGDKGKPTGHSDEKPDTSGMTVSMSVGGEKFTEPVPVQMLIDLPKVLRSI